MPHQPASAALSHIRVLDLTRVRSGPTAVRQLADWGADVIKIEQPESLEADGALGAGRNTPDWQNLQRNRRSLTLNLKSDEGKEIFLKLVKTADVVVENFRPDVKDRLGIDYESLKALNPKIILASISGFGQTGPYAKRPGFDQIAQGMGGLMSITGDPEGGPMRVGIPIADLTAGLFCALGILTALVEREKSGDGSVASHLSSAISGLYARFPSGPLVNEGRGCTAGWQRTPNQHPNQPFFNAGRRGQYRRGGQRNMAPPV